MARSDAAIARLEAESFRWVGTPWCDNSAVLGQGVCCHLLIREVYRGAGWLPDLDVPAGSAAAAKWSNESPILDWFRGPGSRWFAELPADADAIMPGDTLLFTCGHVPHHLGLALVGERVLHVTSTRGVRIVPAVRAWRKILQHAFRPYEL